MMYLNKLEIQGFKSFANKNVLIFSGLINKEKRGLTTIVGPNGSGKSNVADAIRWALGEQSIKTLRGKKSEDIIFSGSNKKSRLSFAEVSLHLYNQVENSNKEKANKIEKESDLDQIIKTWSEIVITRRLFRNGDSEYLLNGNRVRLNDIQLLLAKANFGQKTYSVIGQGMVENFLNTSTAERKNFFDEATGVKQFQIKREAALNKLENSYENLQQVEMLLSEIRPRLRSLTRQVEKLKKRKKIEDNLHVHQLNYYHHLWSNINTKLNNYHQSYLQEEKRKNEIEKKIDELNKELSKLKDNNNYQEINNFKYKLQELYNAKNKLHKSLAIIQAELEAKLESQGKFDLAWLNNKASDIELDLENINQKLQTLRHCWSDNKLKEAKEQLDTLNSKIRQKQSQLGKLKNTINNSSDISVDKEKLKQIIDQFISNLNKLENELDLETIKKSLIEYKRNFIDKIKTYFNTNKTEESKKIEEIQTEIISLTEKKEKLSNHLNSYLIKESAHKEQEKTLLQSKEKLELDLENIKNKLNNSTDNKHSEIQTKKKELEEKIQAINNEIQEKELNLEKLNKSKEEEKSLIFNYQQKIQSLQTELNIYTSNLNDLKINIARQETRSENLETNIKNDNLNILEIQNHHNPENFDLEFSQEKIARLKHQLELIGGIDPETEKEYHETKERFDFLSTQTEDLNKTIKSLENIIQELDATIKTQFDKEFKIIAEKFDEYFKILFNGGQAKISKITNKEEKKNKENQEEEKKDILNDQLNKIKFLKKHNSVGLAGIDIQATPPGKKIQTITMLSGGERALTAIALICAIISANPSPFVILDEVDASLDEANSERFAKILDDLSHKTQFIVITHNRASMKKASILYGVTMEDDGVSKLLSIKLDEVKPKN